MASSSAATSRGSASTIVTSEPKRLEDGGELDADHAAAEHDDARRHVRRAASAWSLVMMRPPISRPGSVLA